MKGENLGKVLGLFGLLLGRKWEDHKDAENAIFDFSGLFVSPAGEGVSALCCEVVGD